MPRRERPYDLLMVGSFGKVKRHFALFKALRRMPREFRVLLIGQDQEGRTAETIHREARWYGVQDRYELRSNQPYLKVVEAFAQEPHSTCRYIPSSSAASKAACGGHHE